MFDSKLTPDDEKRKSRSTPVVTAGSWQFRVLPKGETVIRPEHVKPQPQNPAARNGVFQPYSKEEASVRMFARDLFTCLGYMKVDRIKFS